MTRLRTQLIQGLSYGQGREKNAPMIDVSLGGQYGYQANHGAFVANTGYTPRNVMSFLVDPPRGYDYLPNKDKSIATLRALIETQSKQITGLRTGLTIEYAERQFSHAGHMISDAQRVTEAMSTPTHVWDERYGRAIHNFWQWHTRMLIGEPGTQQPGLMNVAATPPDDALLDLYTFGTLYIESDPLRRFVVEAWLVLGMAPTSTGELESQFDVSSSQGVPEISIEFKGIPIVTDGVRAWAQELLDAINYVNAGPMQRKSYIDKIAADVLAAQGSNYMNDLKEAAANAVI